MSTSSIEISRSAYQHNVDWIKNLIGPNVKFSSVIKGNAYGHGLKLFVNMAESCGVDHFSVFSADEALLAFEEASDESQIMIMGHVYDGALAWAIENEIEFFVFDLDRLKLAAEIAKKTGKKARIHIELETGMNRTGFLSSDIKQVIHFLERHQQYLHFSGLCTHFAGAESIANYYRVNQQRKRFNRIADKFKNQGFHPEVLHTACSAASMRYPSTRKDLVRIGILQYGFFPSPEVMIEYLNKTKSHDYPLRRLITWKSRVMDIKPVNAGEFIGYGTSYLASIDMTIAIIPIGYAHGFARLLSNQGRVLIHGERVSVVGTVNMNMLAIDITNIENVNKGDEVVLIGKQGDLEISVASFSEYSQQLNYEMLVRLPHDIPRTVVD